ncbi:---NA---, partial [Podarcis lilfordi]
DISGDASQLSEVSFSSGETARIFCKHGVSDYNGIFWYKQTRDAAPSLVIYGYSKTEKKERLEMDTDKGNLSTELSISKVEMGTLGSTIVLQVTQWWEMQGKLHKNLKSFDPLH